MEKMIKYLGILLLAATIFFRPNNSMAQTVRAVATIDTNDVMIGDQVRLELKVISSELTRIVWPSIIDTLGPLEVLDMSAIDTTTADNKITMTRSVLLSCYDSCNYEMQPLVFMYERKGLDEMYPAETGSIEFRFNTVEIDTSKSFKDIKGLRDDPVLLSEYIPHIVITVLVLAAIIVGYIFWMRRKPKQLEELGYDPKIPPHVMALEALMKLDSEKLWQSGRVKQYYIGLTDIIRLYIFRQLGIQAQEMISEDIISELKSIAIGGQNLHRMQFLFENADLAKFAKFQPLPDVNAQALTYCTDFVKSTIPDSSANIDNEPTSAEKGGPDA